ncbi:MAG: DinB family protein [Chloroflexi bacterium]|nr:DinB family protein [Chloroflexota bacterium]
MSSRAAGLADAFERANAAVIAAVEACSDAQVRAICEAEGWSVAVAAHHVAQTHVALAGLIQLMASGQPLPPITMEMIDAGNAQHAEEFKNVSKADTLAALRTNGAAAASVVRGLSDEQLDRRSPMSFVGGAEWSTADIIERILIGHPTEHVQSITAAVS